MYAWPDAKVRSHRYLVIEYVNVLPHLETSLEIAVRLAERGAEVDYAHIGAQLCQTEAALYHQPRVLVGPAPSRTRRLLVRWIPRRVKKLFDHRTREFDVIHRTMRFAQERGLSGLRFLTLDAGLLHRRSPASVGLFPNVKALRDRARGGEPFGRAVASSVTYHLRETAPSRLRTAYWARRFTKTYWQAKYLAASALQAGGYTHLVVFNGRFAAAAALRQAGLEHGVEVLHHERGCDAGKFHIYDALPHDSARLVRDMETAWLDAAQGDEAAAIAIANSFYVSKRQGAGVGWPSFVEGQDDEAAREVLRPIAKRPLVAYFSTSDDEFDFLLEPGSPWNDQIENVMVLSELAQRLGYGLVVRVHPGMAVRPRREQWRWEQLAETLSGDHFRIISPNDRASSYAILDAASIVVTSGSTMGLEAGYWDKPSILLGTATHYTAFPDTVAQPRSSAELRALLENPSLIPKDKRALLQFGYWAMVFGTPFKYFEPHGYFEGRWLQTSMQT